MTEMTQSQPDLPAPYTRAHAGGSVPASATDDAQSGRGALIAQALRTRSQLLQKLNRGARQHLRELAQAIGAPDEIALD